MELLTTEVNIANAKLERLKLTCGVLRASTVEANHVPTRHGNMTRTSFQETINDCSIKPDADSNDERQRRSAMARFNFDPKEAPPWTQVFIELAVRGILRVHQDYLGWDIDQIVDSTPNLGRLNTGSGVALADEPTVCAAIAQNFISSRYASGIWFDTNDGICGEHHFYKLTREKSYGENDRTDFICERIHETRRYGASLIEAKRVRIVSTQLDSTEHEAGKSNRSQIEGDIRKLRRNIGIRATTESQRGLILLWNLVDGKQIETEGPIQYLGGFTNDQGEPDDELRVWQIRSVPLESDSLDQSRRSLSSLNVTKWLWVALIEVTPIVFPEKDIPNCKRATTT